MQTLLTGFGPFGSVAANPTERLVRYFSDHPISGHELRTLLLPVSYEGASELLTAAVRAGGREGLPFDIVLMLGVAAGASGWRVERFGRNHGGSHADVDGFTPTSDVIVPDAPDCLSVTLPVEPLVAAIQTVELPAVASDSAGEYLCNHVLFYMLHLLNEGSEPTRAGFLHVPADEITYRSVLPEALLFPFAQQVTAVEAVLRALVHD